MVKRPDRPWKSVGVSSDMVNLDEVRKRAKDKIIRKGVIRNKMFRDTHKLMTFNIGEKVLVYSNQIPKNTDTQVGKWLPLFEGPYIIGVSLQNGTYELQYLDGRSRGKFHTNMLHRYKENSIWEET